MRRVGIAGVCLTATLAFGAMIASAAYAGEAGVCGKVRKVERKFHGRFLEKGCLKEASAKERSEGGEENKREWESPAGEKYTDTSKTTVLSSAAGRMTCKGSTSTGEWTGWQTGTDTITFSECTLSIGGHCTSVQEGEPVGDITTSQLDTYLIDHGTKGPSGLEPKEGEVWQEYQSPTGPAGYQFTFVCEPGVLFRVSGTLSGMISPVNAMETKLTTTFGAGKGEQDLVTEFSEDGGFQWENTGPNVETLVSTANGVATGAKDKGKVEIRACNEPGAVSEGMGEPPCEHEEPLPW